MAAERLGLLAVGWGLTFERYCNRMSVWSEATSATQAEVLRNVEEVETAGRHHPPAVKVGAGVFMCCEELEGLDEVQEIFGLMYQRRIMMSDILKDLSTPALARAIKANMFELFRYLGRSPGAELYDGPNITWLLTRIPTPFLNGVLRTQLTRDNADEAIEETLAHFRSRNVSELWWWTEPDTQPADLGKRLVAHGLTYAEDLPGMAVDLLALNESLTTPSDLTIEHARDMGILKQCVHAAIVGLGLPSTGESAFFNLLIGLGFDLPLRNYVGFLNGEPVASSGLFLAAGVAGIYWVATVPEARRQGIGTALTLAPLREARAMGYRIGILHSSEMGLRVYSRLGFQKYCRMSHYEWRGKRADDGASDGS